MIKNIISIIPLLITITLITILIKRILKRLYKTCPHCRSTIDAKATVCKYCQRDV